MQMKFFATSLTNSWSHVKTMTIISLIYEVLPYLTDKNGLKIDILTF